MSTIEPTTTASGADEISYEQAFGELEQILHALEMGELPLAESLALYEKGVQLAAICGQKLDEAEMRVRRWLPDGSTAELD
ncbi:MAG: exodeoxyribonuclease VII small subunit [Caldilineaceae bacterium]